jgi:hypothetical protein
MESDTMYPISGTPIGYQQITSLSGVTGLTIPAGAKQALIQTSAQIVRMRSDGTNPSSSVGYPLKVGSEIMIIGNLSRLKFIEATSGAVLDVLYFG